VPRFNEKQNIDQQITAYLEQVIDFVGDRVDVQAAECNSRTHGIHMAINVQAQNRRRATNNRSP